MNTGVKSPADLVGLLADAEWLYRENRKLELRLKNAKFKLPACIEDIDYTQKWELVTKLIPFAMC